MVRLQKHQLLPRMVYLSLSLHVQLVQCINNRETWEPHCENPDAVLIGADSYNLTIKLSQL